MNSKTSRFSNRPRWTTALVLVVGGTLGLLVACGSDENPAPSKPPVVSTGGGGSGGGSDNDAGESSGGSTAGSGTAGGANGGSTGNGEGGVGGDDGDAGSGPIPPTCPTTDVGFLNQPSNSQKAVFDNTKRLGASAALPVLP